MYSEDEGSDYLTEYSRQYNTVEIDHWFLSSDVFSWFLDLLAPMNGKIGPLIFQFEYLNKQKMPHRDAFLKRFKAFIQGCPTGHEYGIEIRNPNYLSPACFQFLNAHGLVHVFLQGYYMPLIFSLYEKYRDAVQNLSVIRLHDPDRKGIEKKSQKKWDRLLEPRDAYLAQLATMIRDMAVRNVNLYLNVNNHYEGSAPRTINRIRDALRCV